MVSGWSLDGLCLVNLVPMGPLHTFSKESLLRSNFSVRVLYSENAGTVSDPSIGIPFKVDLNIMGS